MKCRGLRAASNRHGDIENGLPPSRSFGDRSVGSAARNEEQCRRAAELRAMLYQPTPIRPEILKVGLKTPRSAIEMRTPVRRCRYCGDLVGKGRFSCQPCKDKNREKKYAHEAMERLLNKEKCDAK